MVESQSKTTMQIAEESASVTFNPKTGAFKAAINANNILLCLVIIFIAYVSWFIVQKLAILKVGGYAILLFLFIPFVRIVWAITAPMFVKSDKTFKMITISSDLLTKEAVTNFVGYLMNHPLKDIVKLPEPDAKYDPQANKKIPFSNEAEKAEIIKEQEKIVEEVTKDIKAIAENSAKNLDDGKNKAKSAP